jgi:DNA-directed RNA polymerase specialized sigma24 family protein
MPALREIRASLVEVSRRHSRVAHEVEDLAHDLVLAALRRGASVEDEAFLQSVHGSARRHGAFLARSALRRRAREASSAGETVAKAHADAEPDVPGGAPLSVLSPALRTTLLLLLQGLEKAELRLALGVTDAALRKRFQALREYAPLARPEVSLTPRTPVLSLLRRSQAGVLRRLTVALGAALLARPVVAASDPDGHGIIFAEALTPGRPAATSGASTPNARTRSKGTPC